VEFFGGVLFLRAPALILWGGPYLLVSVSLLQASLFRFRCPDIRRSVLFFAWVRREENCCLGSVVGNTISIVVALGMPPFFFDLVLWPVYADGSQQQRLQA